MRRKSREADSLWLVKHSELELSDPPKVIGEGRFGFVLLASYRGSKVAIKKIVPTKGRAGSTGTSSGGRSNSGSVSKWNPAKSVELDGPLDLEEGQDRKAKASNASLTSSSDSKSVDLTDRPDTGRKTSVTFSTEVKELPMGSPNDDTRTASSRGSKSLARRKNEFVQEMRLLSKLRHPNITTVMGKHQLVIISFVSTRGRLTSLLVFTGAVIEKGVEQVSITFHDSIGISQTSVSLFASLNIVDDDHGIHGTRVASGGSSESVNHDGSRTNSQHIEGHCSRRSFSPRFEPSNHPWRFED